MSLLHPLSTMAQPSTPAGGHQSIFGPATSSSLNQPTGSTLFTPSSATSSNNTFLMPNSPVKNRMSPNDYKPKVTRTLGQRPACLVNASVTYCGNNQIYAFGGFDQYTDEVYNHVLKLDMVSHQWSLVDNYGDIPGVRMGMIPAPHTLCHTNRSRSYCHTIPRRQAPDIWRRKRTPNIPLRPHHLRPQNRSLDTTQCIRTCSERKSETCCSFARGQAIHCWRNHWAQQLRSRRYLLP